MLFLSRKSVLACSVAVVAISLSTAAAAQQRSFNLPAQDATTAIPEFARQAGIQVIAPGSRLRGVKTQAITGQHDVRQALQTLLQGTGLEVATDEGAVITLRAAVERLDAGELEAGQGPAASAGPDRDDREIVVTGTRIRGASLASPVITLSEQQMREAGHTNLGEAIRAMPQNFSGGQNPGVLSNAAAGGNQNQNITGGAGLNLRGLGQDATLTLLNSKRLPFSGPYQTVDISAIPLSAVDRLEVVSDGTSAIYGSDAVAGVANVILKRDYDGISASARAGFATDGGGLQQQYSFVGGAKWNDGGLIVTYDFSKDEEIYARQRSYLSYLPEPYMILPSFKRHSTLASAYQDLTSNLTLTGEILYNRRNQRYDSSGFIVSRSYNKNESYVLTPTLTYSAPSGWEITLNGVYGTDKIDMDAGLYMVSGDSLHQGLSRYKNSTRTADIGAEGPVFKLPGGPARLAIGAGYRGVRFSYNQYSPLQNYYDGEQESYFVYGESTLPIISSLQNIPFINRLSLNVAFRHEDYSDFGGVTTPKIGLVYSPTRDITLKTSWGRSFKVPKLLELFSQKFVSLERAPSYVTSNEATVLQVLGGNERLQPETSQAWLAAVELRPRSMPGLSVDLSYLDIRYKNRIMRPIAVSIESAFSDPAYREFVTIAPPTPLINEVISSDSDGVITNSSGRPNIPSNIYGIINNLYANVAQQRVRSLDATVRFTSELANGTLMLSGAGSWLDIKQRNTSSSPRLNGAGVVFRPAHWRARAGATWKQDRFTLSAFANHISGLDNVTTLLDPTKQVASWTTFDATAIFHITSPVPGLHTVDFTLSVRNLTNERPPFLDAGSPYSPNFDSTNHDAIGRFINVSVSTHW